MASNTRNRVLIALGVLAIALLGSFVGYTIADDGESPSKVEASGTDDGPSEADPPDPDDDGSTSDTPGEPADEPIAAPATVPTEGLTGPALDLANAINTASTLTYHAVYRGEYANPDGPTQVTVEIWRQGALARRDSRLSAVDGTLQTRELRLEDQLLGCVDTQKGDTDPEWICLDAATKGTDAAEPILGVARPGDGAVTVRDADVGGVPSRCYAVASPSKTQEVCFDAEGIPTSIDGGDGAIVRTELGRGVDPADIAIPEGAEMREDEPLDDPA